MEICLKRFNQIEPYFFHATVNPEVSSPKRVWHIHDDSRTQNFLFPPGPWASYCHSEIICVLVVPRWILQFQPLTFQAFLSVMWGRTKCGWEGLEPVLGKDNFPGKYSVSLSVFHQWSVKGHPPEECLGKQVIFKQALSYPEQNGDSAT